MRSERGNGPFRLVAVDVDGTLLDHSLVLDAGLPGCIERLRQRGVEFTLATGRVFPSAELVARALGITLPIIANGGAVVRASGREAVHCLTLEAREFLEVLEFTAGCPGPRYVLTAEEMASESGGEHAAAYARRLSVPMIIEPELSRWSGRDVTQVVLRLSPDQAEKWESEGRAGFSPRLQVSRTLPFLVEFAHRQTSKGRALAWLAEHLGIATGQVLAIGDGINDLDMLEVAGCGVLVANADPRLWSRADLVTAAPYGRGVVEALERLVGGLF